MDETLVKHLFDELMRSQFMGAKDIEILQRRHLSNIVAFAYRAIPFWRKRLGRVVRSDNSIDFDKWHEIPVLDGATARKHWREMTTSASPSFAGDSVEKTTSGTTGQMLRLQRSQLGLDFDAALTQRSYTWWKLEPRANLGALVVTADPSSALFSGEGAWSWHFASPEGRAFGFSVATPMEDQLRFIKDRRLDYLTGMPAVLEAVSEYALANNEHVRLKGCLTFGETLRPDQRALIQQAFGAPAFDTYGTVETGHIAAECPECGLYHISSEAVKVEVLDDDNRPAGPGQSGRIVVTSLYNYATPFIRYEIGDRVKLPDRANRCPRQLPSLDRIEGREQMLFLTRAGERFYPALYAREILDLVDASEVQTVQLDFERVEIRYVRANQGRPNRIADLKKLAQERYGRGIDVEVVEVPAIPKPPGGKRMIMISLVPRPKRPATT